MDKGFWKGFFLFAVGTPLFMLWAVSCVVLIDKFARWLAVALS